MRVCVCERERERWFVCVGARARVCEWGGGGGGDRDQGNGSGELAQRPQSTVQSRFLFLSISSCAFLLSIVLCFHPFSVLQILYTYTGKGGGGGGETCSSFFFFYVPLGFSGVHHLG